MDAKITGILITVIGLIVLMSIVAALLPTFVTAGDAINTSVGGTGLGPLFGGNGSIFVLLLLAGIVLVAVYAVMHYVKHK